MAYVSAHPIKTTLKEAITYICNPQKTENQKNIICQNCNHKTAHKVFELTREQLNPNIKNLAFHFIQSFKAGEVTVEQAQEIGMETMKRFLGDEYEFVMATHNDTEHIHNHIIVNSVNMINGKSFSREHDQQRSPAWKRLRQISNEITAERGLSIIRLPDTANKGYYEWSAEKLGISWKAKLRDIINQTANVADSFEDLLDRLRSQNVTVRYEPYKTKEGMILAFKLEGQKNFIYAPKLGRFFKEVNLRNRIERAVKRRAMSPTERRMERIINDDGKLKKMHDVMQFAVGGLREWAKNENRKIQMDTLNEMHNKGFYSAREFFENCDNMAAAIERYSEEYAKFVELEKSLKVKLKYLDIYEKYYDVYSNYKYGVVKFESYFRKHETEIMLCEEAIAELKGNGNIMPERKDIYEQMDKYAKLKKDLHEDITEIEDKLKEYDVLHHNLSMMYEDYPAEYPDWKNSENYKIFKEDWKNEQKKTSETQSRVSPEKPITEREVNAVGNEEYPKIENRFYANVDNEIAEKTAKRLDGSGIKFSTRTDKYYTTFTVDKSDKDALLEAEKAVKKEEREKQEKKRVTPSVDDDFEL